MGFIYKIVNHINGKVYIGKSDRDIDPIARFREHISESTSERSGHRPLYRAINKHGINNFSFHVIEFTDDASEREKFWISEYASYGCNGYNATFGGDGKSYLDYEKIYDYFVKNYEVISLRKIADNLSMDYSYLCKYVKSLGFDSKANSDRYSKRIRVTNLDTGETFNSLSDAAKHIILTKNLNVKTVRGVAYKISIAARGDRRSAYGFKWEYS